MRTSLLALILLISATSLKAQYPFTIKGTTRTLLENDSVLMPSPKTFRGAIEWQKSYDNKTWAVVKTATTADTLAINADSLEIYRLALTEGTCKPIYSDTITIGDAENVNQLLAQGFEVDELLTAGVPLDSLVADNVPIEVLLDAGLSPDTLYQSGVTVGQLVEAGITLDELLLTDIPLIDIYDVGFLVGTLKQHGVDSLELVAAGLIGTLRDVHGNLYTWVRIGEQIWMSQNLLVGQYRGGTVIQTTSPATKDISTYPASACRLHWAYNGDENNTTQGRGYLYTWYAVAGDSICPTGWHVSKNAEWTELVNFLGGKDTAGGKLKTVSGFWTAPNAGATNESGFNGLPAGVKLPNGQFEGLNTWAWFFSIESYRIYFMNGSTVIQITSDSFKASGYSIRCVKDK